MAAKQFIRNWFKQRGRESKEDAFLHQSFFRHVAKRISKSFGRFVYLCLFAFRPFGTYTFKDPIVCGFDFRPPCEFTRKCWGENFWAWSFWFKWGWQAKDSKCTSVSEGQWLQMQAEVPWPRIFVKKTRRHRFETSWTLCLPALVIIWRCWQNISFHVLLEICNLFWSLAKPAQDALLWAMQTNGAGTGESSASDSEYDDDDDDSSEGKTSRKTVKYFLNGVQVCRRAFQRMLGVGCSRMNRTRTRFQGQDERKLQGHGSFAKPALATTSVESFMQKLYYSVSESMPTLWPGFCIIRLSFFSFIIKISRNWRLGKGLSSVDLKLETCNFVFFIFAIGFLW